MNSIILLVDAESVWSPDIWILGQGGRVNSDFGVVHETDDDWVIVDREWTGLEEFDDEEMSRLRNLGLVNSPAVYHLRWRGGRCLKALLQGIPREVKAAVDNDSGLIAAVGQVANLELERWVRAPSLSGDWGTD